jgi:glucuronate isomerase
MTELKDLTFSPDRYFATDPRQKDLALQLYSQIQHLPLVCPHGHVDPRLFADENYRFGTPTQLLLIPDHYIYRMLYSQGLGLSLENLGILRRDGAEVEQDQRKIWQTFADNFHLFRGTPTGMWLKHELREVFGITTKLSSHSAQTLYDQISDKLNSPEFQPRRLFERFNIEVLCTTDAATDTLDYHRAIRQSGWKGRVLPTFRPDAVTNLGNPAWKQEIDRLSEASGIEVNSYGRYIQALENRRAFFKRMGTTATDHGVQSGYTAELSPYEAEDIFQNALKGKTDLAEVTRFTGHILMEMARMSIEDGLVMQLHVGAFRNHNSLIFDRFGPDKGCDIPVQVEFTTNLRPLLNKYGNDSRLTLILFTLDETGYAREMAPLAGHYPALKLGPPWWFHDSFNGMNRYLEQVIETAGLYNTAGFNDDTRAFPSIPARHDLWRRASANWVSGLAVRGIIDREDADEMVQDLAVNLARRTYKLS